MSGQWGVSVLRFSFNSYELMRGFSAISCWVPASDSFFWAKSRLLSATILSLGPSISEVIP